jgi:hypothetical protein
VGRFEKDIFGDCCSPVVNVGWPILAKMSEQMGYAYLKARMVQRRSIKSVDSLCAVQDENIGEEKNEFRLSLPLSDPLLYSLLRLWYILCPFGKCCV